MATPRDFSAVLAAVIAEIPEDEPRLRSVLSRVLDDAGFRAPELLWPMSGNDVKEILQIYMGELSPEELREGWRGRALAAWTGATP